jgi:hypothetical protein
LEKQTIEGKNRGNIWRLKMSESNAKKQKTQPVVTVSIVQGKSTPAQVRQYRAAWARLIAKALSEDGK